MTQFFTSPVVYDWPRRRIQTAGEMPGAAGLLEEARRPVNIFSQFQIAGDSLKSNGKESTPWQDFLPWVRFHFPGLSFHSMVDMTLAVESDLGSGGNHASSPHCVEVSYWVIRIAHLMGFDNFTRETLGLAAFFHDIGKCLVPAGVLSKPGPLDEHEWGYLDLHPALGAALTAETEDGLRLSPIIAAHHEHYDGRGYPLGLQGEEIPLGARIITVVDAFDVMTRDRCYRKAPGKAAALEELQRNKGAQFDPEVVEAFVALLAVENPA
ncbi:MAG: HD domain-containing protein [Anaerolineales bacterium]|nr:HD domain-containing protein [Anaerolineales bacterium]